MTIKEVKAYLMQVEKLDYKIKNKIAEKDYWKSMAENISSPYMKERVQTSASQSKQEDVICRYIDLEKEITKDIDKLIDLKNAIIANIEQLEPKEYDVLHKKYIQGMSYIQIARSQPIPKTRGWATSVRGQALLSLQKILEEQEVKNADNLSMF